MATEFSSGAITSILEAVPGIATVLRSPVADAIVNLSRAAAGLAPFDKKDAHELIRYAVRRGLIRSDEGERLLAELDGVAPVRSAAGPAAAKAAAPRQVKRPHGPAARKPEARRTAARHKAARKAAQKKRPLRKHGKGKNKKK